MSIRGFSCLITFSVIATVAAGAIPPRQWSRPTGLSYDACVATNGDVFVTGTFDGTVDFGDTTVTSAGSRDIVVARYDEDGNTVWVRTAGDSGMFTPFNNAQGVVSTPDGGCVVSGEFYQELAFDSTHVLTTPGGDGFVARYAADGSVMWATSDSISGGYFEGAASDNTGGCYTLSTYFDEEAHVVLTRHDNTGNPRWLLDGTDGLAEAIANDPDGNVVIAGYASASLTLGDSTFLSTTGRNFLAKVDSAGQVLWMRKYGDGVSASDIVVDSTGTVGSYVHMNRIGVLVETEGGDEQLARDLAMQVAATSPKFVSIDDVPAGELAKEREILKAQAAHDGKPPEIVEKMVEGRLRKHFDEVTLLGQPFVKNPDQRVRDLLKASGAKVNRFVRFEVGEGIEKDKTNFADEVAALR